MLFSSLVTVTVVAVGSLLAGRSQNLASQRHLVAQTGEYQPRWGLSCNSVADYIDGFVSGECGPWKYDPKADQQIFTANHITPNTDGSAVETKATNDDEAKAADQDEDEESFRKSRFSEAFT